MSVKVGMVSLGCSKNQVDAERLLAQIEKGGYEICTDASQCDVVIINTCGFIEDAKRESWSLRSSKRAARSGHSS